MSSDLAIRCARCLIAPGVVESLWDHFSRLCEPCAKDESHFRNEHGWVPDLTNLIVDGIVYPNPRKRNDI